jgi:guanosine-3',5'-bis(diphosphate) 3'-pyrophosphohydrolase
MMRQFELVELVKSYDPNADEGALNRAYVYSMRAHGSQLRASGDPYFSHPVEVAGVLAQMKLDTASIVTGLLHDTVEDTVATLDDIERLFGHEIARLVDGVTKLSRIELQSDQTKQAENFRKLVLAMSEDIRVLLVKLADRLHNMRTLHFIDSAEKRRRIARETMDIYAPLAERIGMHRMQDELEDLAFAELHPDARAGIIGRRRRAADPCRTRKKARGRWARRGARLRTREDALFDLAQDAAQERRVRTALGRDGVPRSGR